MINNRTHNIRNIKDMNDLGQDNSLILDNVSMFTNRDGVVFPVNNILRQKYRGVIFENCQIVQFDDVLYEKYKFKPKLLSIDLYGTVELWHLLLWINNIVNVADFQLRKLYVYNPESINVLNKIIQIETYNLETNHESPEEIVTDKKTIRR